MDAKMSAVPYRVIPRKKSEGCQIDLLIQSKRFWYVVEIKLFCLCVLASASLFGAPVADGVFGTPQLVESVNSRASAVAVEGNVLYCGAGGTLYVLDVTVPRAPKLLSQVKGLDLLRQIAVDRGWVAISARGRGVWLVDARNPAKATLASHFETVEQATGIDIAGDALFVGQRGCGVEFVDISDRAHPEHVRMIQTPESQSCLYENGYLYSGEWHTGEVTIIDVHDFATARIVGKTAMQGQGDGFDLDGKYIYASTGHHRLRGPVGRPDAPENWGKGHGFEIWDRSDLANPRFVSRVQFDTFWRVGNDWWTTRKGGDYAFCSDTFNGLYAVNVADPARPFVAGRFTDPSEKDRGAPSRCVSYVAVAEGAVYAAVSDAGLYVLPCDGAKARRRDRGVLPKVTAWRDPYVTASARFVAWQPPTRGNVHSVAAHAGHWYVGCGSAGCYVLDAAWRTCGRLPCAFARDVAVQGGRLLVAEGDDGLGVYSLEEPSKPRAVGRVTRFARGVTRCEWITAPTGRWAICSSRGNAPAGWTFLDLKDLAHPKADYWVDGLPWIRTFASRLVADRWLGYSHTHSFFKWFDLSGETPVMIDTEDKSATGPIGKRVNFVRWRDGCSAFKDDTLLMTKNGKFVRLKAAQDRNADGTPWLGIAPEGCPKGICPEGLLEWNGGDRIVLVNTPMRRIQLYDVSDPDRPRYLWHETISGYPENAYFRGSDLCIPCGYQGLLHLRLE